MGFFASISKAIFREYDRRIKRASLITEYGASQHSHAHPVEADHEDEGEGAEIMNVPRGTLVEPAKH